LNILCSVCYDGSQFSGWQVQPNKITIQSTIEDALSKIYGAQIKTIVAGRTDAGVHSLNNYFNFKVPKNSIPLSKLPVIINNKLPESIRILTAIEKSEDFSARYNCNRRIYEYRIVVGPKNPFLHNYRLFIPKQLNIAAMNSAAKLLIGTHNFAGFRSIDCNAKTSIRTVYESRVFQETDEIIFHIEANAFLKNMVRIITGTLIDIGNCRKDIEIINCVLETRDRKIAGKTVGPQGLFFIDARWNE